MDFLSLLANLGGGILKNRSEANQNASKAIATMQSQVVDAQKELKIWRGVFIGSVFVAVVLILLLILAKRK